MFPSQKSPQAAIPSPRRVGFNEAGMFPSQKSPALSDPPTLGGTASMRPGCFHPRNTLAVGQWASCGIASMRPGCFHPRNALTGQVDALAQRRFNEAGMFPSQKCRRPRTHPPGRTASMRPGCFHPRNGECRCTCGAHCTLQ